jgi:hypothetical protein
MKALVEIKISKKIDHIEVVNAGTEKYDFIVNEILKNRGFEVKDVQIYEGYPDLEKEYSDVEIVEATYFSTVVELQLDEINNFKSHENEIIDKAIASLTSRELDIMGAAEYGKESFLFFNKD